jgi:hypothetical protein
VVADLEDKTGLWRTKVSPGCLLQIQWLKNWSQNQLYGPYYLYPICVISLSMEDS